MSTAICETCGDEDPDSDDICAKLRDEIRKKVFQKKSETGVRGLKERIMDQIYGKNGPGTDSWKGHEQAIIQVKNEIDKLMEEFSKNQCGDKTPLGKDVKEWINRPVPKPEEHKGPVPAKREASEESNVRLFDWAYWEEVTGLTGFALLAYLIISEGSRLFPPRNLVPVP